MQTRKWLLAAILGLGLGTVPAGPAGAQFRFDSPLGTNRPFGNYGPYVTRPAFAQPYANGGLYRSYGGLYSYPRYSAEYPYGIYIPSYSGPFYRYPYSLVWPGIRGTVIPGLENNPAVNPLETSQSFYYLPEDKLVMPRAKDEEKPAADTKARVEVRVPVADADVWFGDHKTKQTGLDRQFVTPPLEPGRKYQYRVRVAWTENGERREAQRTVPVEAGQPLVVDFRK